MLDIDITLLPNYIKQELARSHARVLTLPSAPVSPPTLDRVGCMSVPSASHPLTQGLPLPESFQPVPKVE